MEQLKSMKEQLISQIQGQLANIHQANAHELGAAVDMLKDLSEICYYDSVVKAMEESEKKQQENGSSGTERYYYTERYMPIPYQRTMERDMDRGYGRMYYDGGNGSSGRGGSISSGGYGYEGRENPHDMGGNDHRGYAGSEMDRYYERPYEMIRDSREGRSPTRRRSYMESKETHQPKEKQMQELESYMGELSSDITEMIHDASPEERQMLQKKLTALATKIDQVK